MATYDQVPKYQDLMWPQLITLKKLQGSAANAELIAKLFELYPEMEKYAEIGYPNQPEAGVLTARLSWARSYLKKYGAIDNSQRGVWSLTEKGEQLSETEVKNIPRLLKTNNDSVISENNSDASNNNLIENEIGWKDTLRETILSIPADAFERLCMRLLREAGFTKVEVTGRSGDGGIDGKGILTLNGMVSFHVSFQSKRYKASVGSGEIRDFRGAFIGRSDKGILIATGTFTPAARLEAIRDGAPTVDLIDGDELCEQLKKYSLGVTCETVERISIQELWYKSL